MSKRLITIVGANGVGKTTTSNSLLQMCPNSAYVDADWCRAINPFKFTEATKKTVTDNIFCLFRNYLLCSDIETVIFPYGFHGERKSIYDEVIHRLRDEGLIFDEHIVVLKCEYEENIKRSIGDNRDNERVERGMRNTFNFYDGFAYPTIDTTTLSPAQDFSIFRELNHKPKTAVIFHPRKDGDYSGFVFSEERCQTAFLQFGYHFRGKYVGVQRDAIPWLWVSNRGEKHPCWHTIFLWKV